MMLSNNHHRCTITAINLGWDNGSNAWFANTHSYKVSSRKARRNNQIITGSAYSSGRLPVNDIWLYVRANKHWHSASFVIICRRVDYETNALRRGYSFERFDLPSLRYHPNFSLLVTWSQFHENPIRSKCTFTACSSVATCFEACGIGVSYRSASSFTRWVCAWLMRSISP